MKAVSMYNPYGWKGKIGLIIPSTNTINEPEFWRMAPPGITIHSSRVLLLGKSTRESYFEMASQLERAARELATAEVDVIAYGCTSGSIICPLPELLKGMSDVAGVPATAAAGAVVAALRQIGVKRVALATPYMEFVNEAEIHFLQQHGFEVTSSFGLNMGENQEERRGIGRVPPEAVFRMARHVDRPEAQAIFISCTQLPTLPMIGEIERELGKPVVISNQACMWSCLRLLGITTPLTGFGHIHEHCLKPLTQADVDLR